MSINIFLDVAKEELSRQGDKLPPKGELCTDKNEKLICHICGKSFNNLSLHIVQKHNMSIDSYKEEFELKKSCKLTSKKLNKYFKEREREDITKHSSKTRFSKGKESVRKGENVRLQVLLERPIEYKKKLKHVTD